jgi:pantoate--beta-alanine ligase
MKIVNRITELKALLGSSVGLVPTMGSLHAGHLQLMKTARAECSQVVVSLFVNPTQFGAGEDFERYPRDLDRDAELTESVGVDILFAPTVEEVYPRLGTTVHVPAVTSHWEGAVRPGHFVGVATVVCKLFNIVEADIAYFGLKDLQQCLVIKRMVEDLNMPIRISLQPTVRESDGLAMSSRNAYLTEEERNLAPLIYNQLTSCKHMLLSSVINQDSIEEAVKHSKVTLEDAGFRVDYFDLIELENAHETRSLSKPCALVVAAKLGKTRLIDNVLL